MNAGKNTRHYTNSFIREGTCDDNHMREASLFSFLKSHEEIFFLKKHEHVGGSQGIFALTRRPLNWSQRGVKLG
jgi:hypothetical protein